MSEGTLEIRNIDEADLAAWSFVNLPSHLSNSECREQVEYEILCVWDRDCTEEGWLEEDRAEFPPAISPYWLYRVESARAAAELDSLPMDRRLAYLRKSVENIWNYRTRNREAIAARTMPPLPAPLPIPPYSTLKDPNQP